jgi:hypothetical protein
LGSTNSAITDTFNGGFGNDSIYGNEGSDRLFGGAGNDIIYAGNPNRRITNTGNNTLVGGDGNDGIFGGTGNDILFGDYQNDPLPLTPPLTSLGNDVLVGGNGSNILVGGAGADTLTGGTGFDWFAYLNANEGGDTITNFTSGQDKILLNAAQFGLNITGTPLTGTGHPLANIFANQFLSPAANQTTVFRELRETDFGIYQNVTAAQAGTTALALVTPAYDPNPLSGGSSVTPPDALPGLYSVSGGSATLIASFSNGALPGYNNFINPNPFVTTISDILIYDVVTNP